MRRCILLITLLLLAVSYGHVPEAATTGKTWVAVVTYVVGYFARELSFTFFGWPFSFWVGSQGALVVYVLIIWFYANYMNKLDREHGVAEEE